MSFNKSKSGTLAIVLAAIAAFPDELRTSDAGQPQGVIDGHQKQITAGVKIATDVLEGIENGDPIDVAAEAQISVSIYGHANADGGGTFGLSISNIPIPGEPVAAEEPPEPAEG